MFFLFFLNSTRDFNLEFSSFEFNYLYNNASRLYAVALQNDGTRLAPPKKTDVEPVKAAEASENKKKDKKSEESEKSCF